MAGIDYLDGFIYHMVHFDTSKRIFQRRAMLCKRGVDQEKIPYLSIANDDVQDIRDRILIWDSFLGKYRFLHSYVPFYFAIRPPMLHNMFTRGIQDEIVIFAVGRSILRDQGVLFTDGNASNQQLARNGGESVIIEPATALTDQCIRKYLPSGPHGKNENCSNFYRDSYFLDRLNWYAINNRRSGIGDSKRQKQAEILIPNSVSLRWIRRIVVSTERTAASVCSMVDASKGGRKCDIKVEIVKDLFF